MKIRTIIPAFIAILVAFCVPQRTSVTPYGGVGTLVAIIVDSTGVGRVANAYLVEDPRVTPEVILRGNAGVWADDKGVARLGTWSPGEYTLVIRGLGYYQQRRSVTLRAGRADTVRITVRTMNMTTQ